MTIASTMQKAESVGLRFSDPQLLSAQQRTWQAIYACEKRIEPGMSEKHAHQILKEILKEMGAEKIWHAPQIRFGSNTTKPFGKPSDPNVVLAEKDLFFLDIGPVFDGFEGDAGQSFVRGDDVDMLRIVADSKKVFSLVKARWSECGLTGRELYEYAQGVAEGLGWHLSLEGASGHRVSDFPHALHYKGKLAAFGSKPAAHRWILEIHLFHPTRALGAFFEDLL